MPANDSPAPLEGLPMAAVEALLACGGDMLLCTDVLGRITWRNARFDEFTGLSASAVIGRTLQELLLDATTSGARRQLAESLAAGRGIESIEIALPAAGSNERMWCRLHTSPFAASRANGEHGDHDDHNDSARGFVAVLHDHRDAHRERREAQRLAELLDMAQEFGRLGVWERDIPSGEGRWDRHVFRMFDMDPRQGTPNFAVASQRIHPDDRVHSIYLESTKTPGRYARRYRVFGQDGVMRVIHSQWEVQPDAQGRPVRSVGILVDDTEVYEMARSISELNAQLNLALDLADIALWRHDLATNLMHYDERAWRILGMEPRHGGLPLSEVRSLVHPDDVGAVVESAQRALQTNGPVDFEARYRHADGSWRYIMTRRAVERDARGQPVAFIGVALDMTARVAESHRAVDLARRLDTITRAAGLGVWSISADDGQSEWNAQMFDLFGLPRAAHPPAFDVMLQLVHPDDRERLAREGAQWIRGGSYMFEIEYRVILPDGTVRWLLNRSDVESRGGPRRLSGVTMDVTERKRIELEREERLAAQRESLAKSQFLARMSHELRTPLNAVLGFTQLLLGDDTRIEAATRQRRLEHIRSAGEHLLSLINDVLDLSSLQSGEMKMALEPVRLAPLVRDLLVLLEPQARARAVMIECGPLDAVCWADPTRLKQVLLNLLSNAIKYNRNGGRVQVRAVSDGTHVRLCVADTGRGLTPEQQKHLYEPFNRLGIEREGIEGTGVGLTVVKALVERMNGEISATSQVGVGSEFCVRLDDASDESAPPPVTMPGALDALGEEPKPYSGRLLYIEDNPVNLLIVQELISRCPGLTFDSAPDGAQGVSRAQATLPDMVLVDMQLPDFDGYEVLRRLRAHASTASIPCVALSANAMPEDIQRALAAGFADYWTKPIDFGAFMESMETLFARR